MVIAMQSQQPKRHCRPIPADIYDISGYNTVNTVIDISVPYKPIWYLWRKVMTS
jgi:hypothetical protein